MKDFLKYIFATVIGILICGLIFLFAGVIFLVSAISLSKNPVSVKPESVLKVELNGLMHERYSENPLDLLMSNDHPAVALDQLTRSIRLAAENPSIKGIYIEAGALLGSSPAMNEQIREALSFFKESGKPIVAYGDLYTQDNYYICSTADYLVLNPKGQILWQGLVSEPVFYKEVLQKIGVEMQVFRVGNYKSAVEPFTETKMSAANREQIQSYLGSIWNTMLEGIGQDRDKSNEELNNLADRFLSMTKADSLVQLNMADTLLYKTDMEQFLKQVMKTEDKPNLVSPSDLILAQESKKDSKKKDQIAIYYAFGDIVDQSTGFSTEEIVSKKVCKDLKELAENDDIKAVVLRINSGGGSAYASEQIWYSIEQLKAKKPVIISMGGMAASGGYYMACAGNKIVTYPTTLTGSIGIFGLIPNASNLLKEKIGLHFDVVKTNTHSDFGSISRPFNAEERSIMQQYINQGYDLFVKRVAEGRGMTEEQVRELAQGRVWTGQQAVENGLADTLGGIETALNLAAETARIQDYAVKSYPVPTPWYEELLKEKQTNYIQSALQEVMGPHYSQMLLLKQVQKLAPIQARIPYEPNIK